MNQELINLLKEIETVQAGSIAIDYKVSALIDQDSHFIGMVVLNPMPAYSRSVGALSRLIIEGSDHYKIIVKRGVTTVKVYAEANNNDSPLSQSTAKTLPLALCSAFLKRIEPNMKYNKH